MTKNRKTMKKFPIRYISKTEVLSCELTNIICLTNQPMLFYMLLLHQKCLPKIQMLEKYRYMFTAYIM